MAQNFLLMLTTVVVVSMVAIVLSIVVERVLDEVERRIKR